MVSAHYQEQVFPPETNPLKEHTVTGMKNDFWDHIKRLLRDSRLIIDRPKGSRHPHYPDAIYPLDYGYLEGTISSDNSGIVVWVGSQSSRRLTGIACTYDTLKKDAEIKLLAGCSEEDIKKILDFYALRMKTIIIPEPLQGAEE